jgi:transcriptional regulator with XRE-family HTH domain
MSGKFTTDELPPAPPLQPLVLSPAKRRQMLREGRGWSLQEAARRARVSPRLLREVERHGGASYALACRLGRLYQCRIDLWLK